MSGYLIGTKLKAIYVDKLWAIDGAEVISEDLEKI